MLHCKRLLILFLVDISCSLVGILPVYDIFHIIKNFILFVLLFRQNRLFFFFFQLHFCKSSFFGLFLGVLVLFFFVWLVFYLYFFCGRCCMNSVLKSRSNGQAKLLAVQGRCEKLLHLSNL